MANLPLNGRIFTQLGMVNPGVNQKAYSASGGFTANGLPSPYVNIQMDSGEIMDFADQNGQIGVLANFAPSVDSIAEFTMQTSSYSAQYGKNAGANVNIVTKSGTNLRLEFRSEWFNIFNQTQFVGVGTTLGTPTFGRVTSARDARIGQMAIKLLW